MSLTILTSIMVSIMASKTETSSGGRDQVMSGQSDVDSGVTVGTSSGGSDGNNSSKQMANYCHNYFNIDDIMAGSQRLLSTALAPMVGLGPVLDPNGDTPDVAEGTKLELPLWLARELHSEGLVSISVPKGYNRTYREILEADANCTDLHKLGPDFYRLGQHLSHMNLDESEDIANSLVQTFHQRYHRLVNYSLSATNDTINEVQAFRQQLDNEEKQLFNTGKQSLDETKEWENRSIEKVTANDLIVNLRKRKRIVMNDINACPQSSLGTH